VSPRPSAQRRQPCSTREARARLRQAEAYLTVAMTVVSEADRPEDYDFNHVAAGLAVLASIAASDALCCRLLSERSRGQNHRDAIGLLGTIRFGDGVERARARRARGLSEALATSLDLKDASHYGTTLLEAPQVRKLLRTATKLVDAAKTVVG
jgi:hypothetical protein